MSSNWYIVLPPGLLRNRLRTVPDTTASTGVPLGSGMSIASWGCPLCTSANVSLRSARDKPWMGGLISRMEEVALKASNTAISPALQTRSFILFLQDHGCPPPNHVRKILHIPVRQSDATGRFA